MEKDTQYETEIWLYTKEPTAWELIHVCKNRKAASLPFKKITDNLNQNHKIIL